jgi:hypothetical protein
MEYAHDATTAVDPVVVIFPIPFLHNHFLLGKFQWVT